MLATTKMARRVAARSLASVKRLLGWDRLLSVANLLISASSMVNIAGLPG
jgi:hypothetical protein